MKKILCLSILLCCSVFVTGCFFTNASQYGTLEGIAFYDIDQNEIMGEYKNYYEWYEYFNRPKTPLGKRNSLPLNSPAPIELYYCADVHIGDTVIVRFKIKCNQSYRFSSLKIQGKTVLAESFHDIKDRDGYTYVDYVIESIEYVSNEDQADNIYQVSSLKLEKQVNHKTVIVSGSTRMESRTYLNGFYFNILDVE